MTTEMKCPCSVKSTLQFYPTLSTHPALQPCAQLSRGTSTHPTHPRTIPPQIHPPMRSVPALRLRLPAARKVTVLCACWCFRAGGLRVRVGGLRIVLFSSSSCRSLARVATAPPPLLRRVFRRYALVLSRLFVPLCLSVLRRALVAECIHTNVKHKTRRIHTKQT